MVKPTQQPTNYSSEFDNFVGLGFNDTISELIKCSWYLLATSLLNSSSCIFGPSVFFDLTYLFQVYCQSDAWIYLSQTSITNLAMLVTVIFWQKHVKIVITIERPRFQAHPRSKYWLTQPETGRQHENNWRWLNKGSGAPRVQFFLFWKSELIKTSTITK